MSKQPVFEVSRQRGVSLIEVLVTVLILSVSLMTLASLQTRSLQFNHGAYLRSQANILAYEIMDRIRINESSLSAYNITIDAEPPTGTSVAATDIAEWRALLGTTLPAGTGSLNCVSATGMCVVVIRWDEQSGGTGRDDEDTSLFTYATRIRI